MIKEKITNIVKDYIDNTYMVEQLTDELMALLEDRELFCLVEWINGNPILDGSKYYTEKREAIDVAETKMETYRKAGILEDIDVKHTIIRLDKRD